MAQSRNLDASPTFSLPRKGNGDQEREGTCPKSTALPSQTTAPSGGAQATLSLSRSSQGQRGQTPVSFQIQMTCQLPFMQILQKQLLSQKWRKKIRMARHTISGFRMEPQPRSERGSHMCAHGSLHCVVALPLESITGFFSVRKCL